MYILTLQSICSSELSPKWLVMMDQRWGYKVNNWSEGWQLSMLNYLNFREDTTLTTSQGDVTSNWSSSLSSCKNILFFKIYKKVTVSLIGLTQLLLTFFWRGKIWFLHHSFFLWTIKSAIIYYVSYFLFYIFSLAELSGSGWFGRSK